MKKNRIVSIFGAVIITLLITSSATALNITTSHKISKHPASEIANKLPMETINDIENKKPENKDKIYVDPDIKITKNRLPRLRKLLKKIDESDNKKIISKIIETIETKGELRADDMKNILIKLDMTDKSVYSGFVNGYACCSSVATGLPFLPGGGGVFWMGPGLWCGWIAMENSCCINEIDFTIGGDEWNREHVGDAYLFIGIWSFAGTFQDGILVTICNVDLWSPLIIVSE